jgi:hypothetical protein
LGRNNAKNNFRKIQKKTTKLLNEYKTQCAVRQLCKWRHDWGIEKFRTYLAENKINKNLLEIYSSQWQKGNKGEWATWI